MFNIDRLIWWISLSRLWPKAESFKMLGLSTIARLPLFIGTSSTSIRDQNHDLSSVIPTRLLRPSEKKIHILHLSRYLKQTSLLNAGSVQTMITYELMCNQQKLCRLESCQNNRLSSKIRTKTSAKMKREKISLKIFNLFRRLSRWSGYYARLTKRTPFLRTAS